MEITFIFSILILIMSVVVHEVSHGFMAEKLGDHTARYAGRLTLNPIPHIDPIGSIVVPLLLIVFQSPFLFGWAKPVPVNTYNIRHKYGSALVSFAGPGANLAIVFIFAMMLRFFPIAEISLSMYTTFFLIIKLNAVLAIFNLIPIPPLDGSHILFNFLPPSMTYIRMFLEQNGFYILMGIILLNFVSGGLILGTLFNGVIDIIFRIFIGI